MRSQSLNCEKAKLKAVSVAGAACYIVAEADAATCCCLLPLAVLLLTVLPLVVVWDRRGGTAVDSAVAVAWRPSLLIRCFLHSFWCFFACIYFFAAHPHFLPSILEASSA